jgi:hypothetical protein
LSAFVLSTPVAPARFQAIDWYRLHRSEVRKASAKFCASSVLAKTGDEREISETLRNKLVAIRDDL